MNARFLIFVSIVTAILSAACFYVGSRAIALSPWIAVHRESVWLFFALFVLLQILGPYLYRVTPDRQNRLFVLHWMIYMTLGAFACVFFYVLAADVLMMGWRFLFGAAAAASIERRSFLGVAAATAASVILGAFQAARAPRVYEVNVPIKGLPEAFDGFRILQISDLHVGPTIGRAYAERVTAMGNSLSPDLVALTGDFIDGTVDRLRDAVAPLKDLRAPYGVYYVTGNHEYYWGAREWVEEFRRLDARVLLNEHTLIRKGDAEIVIAGIADEEAGGLIPEHASDPIKAVAGAPAGAIKILLAHRPSAYKKAAEAGFDLQLSGHTHGGQFFPWSLVVGMAYRFTKGLHRFEDLWVYVSRGTGYWGPPVRFGVPGEMTLLKLRRGDSQSVR
jgi:uncharacterized protein